MNVEALIPTSDAFAVLDRQPPDALLAVIGMHRADQRPDKMDLGVGVYRDAAGTTPVMRAIKAAEHRLASQQQTKSYLGADGDALFSELLARWALGDRLASDGRMTGVQTPGGTGALRLAAELLARTGTHRTVWIGTPTWPNHGPIFREAGLEVREHRYFDACSQDIDFDGVTSALLEAAAGDVVLLHGCCHNPTGASLTLDQWQALTALIARRGLLPLVDLAYQGLGRGWHDDVEGVRHLLERVPETLVAYSCDKNFGLYRERVGALWAFARCEAATLPVRDNLLVLARSLWSMPPDHGAACVRTVLDDAELSLDWMTELDEMRARIQRLRRLLASEHPALAPIARQEGLFALLPLKAASVRELRERQAIYMPASGRINIAGLREDTVARFAAAVSDYL